MRPNNSVKPFACGSLDPMPVLARDEEEKKRVRDADEVDTDESERENEVEAKVNAMFDR